MILYPTPQPEKVKVRRDGPRGWHWISAESYDPAQHVLVDEGVTLEQKEQPAARRGRKPKIDRE